MPIQLTWIKIFGAKDFLGDTLWTYAIYENEQTLDIIKAMYIKETAELIQGYQYDNYTLGIKDANEFLEQVKACNSLLDFQELEHTIYDSYELLGSVNE